MSIRNRWFLLFSALASVTLIAAVACGGGKSSSDKTASATGSGTPTSGQPADLAPDDQQVLTFNAQSEPSSLDPQALSYNYELTIAHNLYVTLLDQNPKTSELIPWAAAEVPTTANGGIAADGVTYTIKIKPGLKWSDGSPLTAKDFAYGITRSFNLNVSGSGYGGFFTNIKGADAALKLDPKSATYVQDVQAALKDSIVAVDDTTLKLVANTKSASFLSNLTLAVTSAVQQANVEALGADFGTTAGASKMVTSGPFTLKEWVAKDHATIAASDAYNAGKKPYLKQVSYKFIEDQNQAYNAYQANQVDEANVPAALYPSISADSSMKDQVHQEEEFGTRWIHIDVTVPPWNNKDFVIAMNQATDRDAIGSDVYFGLRKPYTAVCPSAVVACDTTLFSNLEYNVDAAKASMAKAYPDGNIPEVTLETVDDPTTKALVTTLQSQWSKVGVKANIVTTDQATLRADMKNHKAGTQITGWGMDYADATDIWAIFTTPSIGATNLGFYSRTEYDQLEAQQDAELDPAKRAVILKQLQQFLAADPPVIEFAIQLRTDVYKPYVKGLVSSPFDYILYGDQNLVQVYVAKH